ncbi:hypothetical protein [Paludibacterium yongneupense]|uniref:hypothetical protein n=1 Tax=Paludibacterium yongneupense TaxID=400061 RepID=UPI0004217EEB|nr:hypothetical protein [Paludibacterium yongneupense]
MNTQSSQASANVYSPTLNGSGLPGLDYDIDPAWQQRLGSALIRFLVRSLQISGQHPVQW